MSTSDSELLRAHESRPSLSVLLKASGTPLVLDGALATYLETLGADLSTALWSAQALLTQPSLIYQTHLASFHSGANIATTSSYQASIQGLTQHLHISENAAKELLKKSVNLTKQARDVYSTSLSPQQQNAKRGKLLVAGSVGPYGAFLADGSEYRGDYVVPRDDMMAFHRGRVQALVDGDVDVLACETMPSFAETEALMQLLRTEFSDAEAWFSFTLKDALHISDGTPLSKVAGLLDGYEKVVAVGVNCVSASLAMDALRELKNVTGKPLIVYPNSGEVWNAEKREWEGEKTDGQGWAELAIGYSEAGAQIIGGCCRTMPKDVESIAKSFGG
ncbi:Homocysteine S-methyltransferase [Polyplosphaeria fusca]|uniref:Homocysteine S-methyltransferase n=1 Tax=Polyplosphaeria fusca TaxID=682080 RepID=A0A9P4R2J3_9PLEO|nr:Homocysteine S-methyltransferase [Polyplosphaeria fusca]